MDRIAVIADVHADARSLLSVLAAIERLRITRVWCLGDFCSGGADPVECFDLITDLCEVVLIGNHEVFIQIQVWRELGLRGGWAGAAEYAFNQLGERRRGLLAEYPSHCFTDEAELVHGALTNPVEDFLIGADAAGHNLRMLRRPLLLYGHTHQAACWAPGEAVRAAREQPVLLGREYLLPTDHTHPQHKRLLNPGAVCDRAGARWLELRLAASERIAIWHQTDTPGTY